MNKNTRSLLIGLGLGDGYYFKTKCKIKPDLYSIAINHCDKQKDYLIWKKDLLIKLIGGHHPKISKINNNKNSLPGLLKSNYIFWGFKKSNRSYFKYIHKYLYKDNKKVFLRSTLNKLNAEAIAIWWMDDGCLSPKIDKNTGKIKAWQLMLNTYLSPEENQIIIDYFKEVWGVEWKLNKHRNLYRLRMYTKEGRNFLPIIRDYINEQVPCMSYKVKNI